MQQFISSKNGLPKSVIEKTSFDMNCNADKALAMNVCTPLSTVIGKIGSLFSNGKFYVMDKDGNESSSYENIRNLLSNPNVLQTGRQFFKQVEMCLKLFGYCPIYKLRASKTADIKQLWIIPPESFHLKTTGKCFKQSNLKDIISEAYIECGLNREQLEEYEYFIIFDSEIIIPHERDREISFRSNVDSLSIPVSTWMAQAIASNTLIVDGGPKGIIYNDDTSEFANSALTPEESKRLNNEFKNNYGLVNKAFSILITKAKIGWKPLNYDSGQLKLHEEDKRCKNDISNALNINPNVFNSDSKYENQESAERKAYQSLIIPDSILIAEALTREICGKDSGAIISIDYSHVECLQSNKKEAAMAFYYAQKSVSELLASEVINKEEARIEIAKYIEINPNQ